MCDPRTWAFEDGREFRLLLKWAPKRTVLRVRAPRLDACVEGCKCGGDTPADRAVITARELTVHGYPVPKDSPLYLCREGFVIVGEDGTTSPPKIGGVCAVDDKWVRKTKRALRGNAKRKSPRPSPRASPRKRSRAVPTRWTPPRKAKCYPDIVLSGTDDESPDFTA